MKRMVKNDQSGMVAIMVTMIMMFVITLLVLGFSETTRRNQREALDTQLGTQAYYAAETGVNDVVRILNATPGALVAHNDCSGFTMGSTTLPRKLKADDSVANTCLMIDSSPVSLAVDGISPGSDTVMWRVHNATAGTPFSKLTFTWSPDPALTGNCSTAIFKTYPTAADWKCNRALVRVDILRADLGTTDADQLAANTTTLYLQPNASSQQDITIASFGNPIAQQGACKVPAAAAADQSCHVDVNLTSPLAQTDDYYVRITSMYADAKNLQLSGTNSIALGGGASHFRDGQIVIDSTGRAQDQLKRIRVRVPLSKANDSQPVFAAQSAGTTCKDLLIYTTVYYSDLCP